MKKMSAALIVLLLMGAVLYFSSQVGGVSHGLSQKVAYKIIAVMELSGNHTQSLYTVNMIVRKLAHFFEYLLLGAFLAMALTNLLGRVQYGVLLAGILGVAFAFVDEWVQSGAPGRTQSIFDVLVDTAGLCVGLMVFCIVLIWVQKKQMSKS
jgi:VanZ family protein